MRILDRYLLRQFIQVFAICFLSLMGLYVVIDAFGHLDNFSRHAEEGRNLFSVIGEYYAYQSLSFFDQTGGILVLIAAMFTVTWLQRHQEMTAMLAAGVSKARIVRPLILASLFISFLGVANREFLLPSLRDELSRDTDDLAGEKPRDLEARYDLNDVFIGGDKLVVPERKIVNPLFMLPNELSTYGKQLAAETAYHLEGTEDHPSGFLLENVVTPVGIDDRPSLSMNDTPIILTSLDNTWLEPKQIFVKSPLPFKLLASGSAWHSYASTKEIVTELNSPSTDIDSTVRVAVHARITRPFMDTTLLMLGLPLMFSRRQRNVFLSIGICLAIALSFSLFSLVCQSLGGIGLLRPTLAAWLPVLVFVPISVSIAHTLRT